MKRIKGFKDGLKIDIKEYKLQRLAAFKRATTHKMEKRDGGSEERNDKLCRIFRCLNHGFNAEYNDLRLKSDTPLP